jgi:hypothetical protein
MRIPALILCAAVLAAGCGDDEETSDVETAPVTTTETVVPEPVDPTPTEPEEPDAPADGHGGQEAPRKCGRLAFEPNTDSGASGIRAAGGNCGTARDVARAAEPAREDLSYEKDGFECQGAHSDQIPINQIEWRCVGPDREVVRFVTS